MRKLLSVLLILVLCLGLSGCKSKEAQAVEDMVNALGEITIDSEMDIAAARSAYDALSDKDKEAIADSLTKLEEAEARLDFAWTGYTLEGLTDMIFNSSDIASVDRTADFDARTFTCTLNTIYEQEDVDEWVRQAQTGLFDGYILSRLEEMQSTVDGSLEDALAVVEVALADGTVISRYEKDQAVMDQIRDQVAAKPDRADADFLSIKWGDDKETILQYMKHPCREVEAELLVEDVEFLGEPADLQLVFDEDGKLAFASYVLDTIQYRAQDAIDSYRAWKQTLDAEFGPAWMDEIVVAEGHTADAFSEANNLDLGITRYEAFWDVEDTRYMLFLTRIASSVYQLSLGFGPL